MLYVSNEIMRESGNAHYKTLYKQNTIILYIALFPLGSRVSLVFWLSKTLGYNPNREELSHIQASLMVYFDEMASF